MNIQKIHVMAIVCCLLFFYRAGTANAESYDLWGKQARSIPSGPVQKYQGNTITLKKTAIITKVEGNALEYTIWRVEPDTNDMLGTQVPVHTGPGTVSHDLQTDMKIEPVADSHVYAYSYRNWNKANWGKYGSLGAGWNPTGGEKRTYLKFDISGVDPKNVGKATLKLFHYHTGGNNSLSVGIHRVTGTWQEGGGTYHSGQTEKSAAPGEISWVAQPPFSPYQSANFTPGPGANNYIEVDITQLVKQWLSGVPDNGLVLKVAGSLSGGTPESSYGFYSREHTDKSKRPVLILSASSTSATPTGHKKPVKDYKSIVGVPCGTDREFVYSMFQCIFERDPEKKEVDEQVRDLQNGMSRKDIVVRFFKSDEYNSKFYDSKTDGHYWTVQTWNSFYKDVYQAVFGLNRNFNNSVFPKTYHHRVVAQLFDTEEYRNLCPGKGSEYNPLKDPGVGISDKKQSKDKIDDLIKQYHDQKYPDTKKDNDQKKGAVYDQSPDYTDGSIGDKSTPVEDKKITDKPDTDVINTPARKCADNVKDAYQQYLRAYNKITQLMQQGESDTPRAQRAYENYKFYKDCYEAVEKAPAPSDN